MIYLEEHTVIDAPIQRCFDLARSVEVHLLSNVHSGEQALATGGMTYGLVGLHEEVTWRAKHFGVWQNLTSRTTELRAPAFLSGDDGARHLSRDAGRITSSARCPMERRRWSIISA